MEVLQNFILVLSILLALSTGSNSKNIKDLGPPGQIKLSNMSNVKLGYGTIPNYLPIIEYKRISRPLQVNCVIQIRTGEKCNLSLDISKNVVEAVVNEIVQLDEKKVIISWKEITTGVRYRDFIERITSLDMSTCKSASSLSFPLGRIGLNNFIYTIPYKNGFDVILSVNSTITRTGYDVEGQKIGESEPFLPTNVPSNINPLSLESQSKAFFMVSRDAHNFTLNFVDKKVNRLIESEAVDVVSHINHSIFSACWDDIMQNETMFVYCAKFDLSGKKNYREQFKTIPYHDWFLEVRNSRDGGLVLFTYSDEHEMLYVSAIKSNIKVETLSYNVRSVPGNRKILDLDEEDGTFVFAYESGEDFEGKVVLQKFYLPSEVQSDVNKV